MTNTTNLTTAQSKALEILAKRAAGELVADTINKSARSALVKKGLVFLSRTHSTLTAEAWLRDDVVAWFHEARVKEQQRMIDIAERWAHIEDTKRTVSGLLENVVTVPYKLVVFDSGDVTVHLPQITILLRSGKCTIQAHNRTLDPADFFKQVEMAKHIVDVLESLPQGKS